MITTIDKLCPPIIVIGFIILKGKSRFRRNLGLCLIILPLAFMLFRYLYVDYYNSQNDSVTYQSISEFVNLNSYNGYCIKQNASDDLILWMELSSVPNRVPPKMRMQADSAVLVSTAFDKFPELKSIRIDWYESNDNSQLTKVMSIVSSREKYLSADWSHVDYDNLSEIADYYWETDHFYNSEKTL